MAWPNAPGDTGFPVIDVGDARFGFPTCWDQWIPELARIYLLAGAEILVFPTAIGSEPDLDLDLDQRRDWLTFGLLSTRRPEQYRSLSG